VREVVGVINLMEEERMMKRFVMVLAFFAALALALPAMAAEVKIKGDFDNRFMVYTDHNDWLTPEKGVLKDGNSNDSWGEAKYRMWFDASTNDGKVKGVWAFEVGGLQYGAAGNTGRHTGGSYSGDSVNLETRWLYTDFQLPWASNKFRIRMGLQPFNVNPYLWQETIMGVKAYGSINAVDWEAAWLRPARDETKDPDDDVEDLDAFYARVNCKPMDGLKMGVFGVYFTGDSDNDATTDVITSQDYEFKNLGNKYDIQVFAVGTDGSWANDSLFAKWDFIYENGDIDDANFALSYNGVGYTDNGGASSVNNEDFDLEAYFLHVDLGFKMDAWKFTYTFWYASGDDDPNDSDFDGFMAVDIDRTDSICIFEGGFTDDNYFTEKDYILDKGFIMNKLAVDYKVSNKLTMGGAVMYMMTAEDIEYGNESDDSLGIEVDASLTYKIYDNLEFAVNAGYLFADDAMDFFEENSRDDVARGAIDEPDGDSDEDIFVSTARVRYKF